MLDSLLQDVLFIGYQSEDIIVSDPSTFLCVLGNVVLDENGLPVQEHKYVFSPEVVQRKVRHGKYSSRMKFLCLELLF